MSKRVTKNMQDEISAIKTFAVFIAIIAVIICIYFVIIKNIEPIEDKTVDIAGYSLSFDSDVYDIEIGQREKLDINFVSGNIVDTSLLYSSSDESVVSVDNNGYIDALSIGQAVIKAANAEGKLSAEITVVVHNTGELSSAMTTTTTAVTTAPVQTTTTVTTTTPIVIDWEVEVESIALSKSEISLDIWEIEMPMVTMLPSTAKDKSERWSSSDESIAVVDAYGNIRGVAPGQCVITVTSVNNPNLSASVNVIVSSSSLVEGVTFIDGIMVVNKSYPLPVDYVPQSTNDYGLDDMCYSAYLDMKSDAQDDGISLYISSAYRSYSTQSSLYSNYVANRGQQAADTFSARAGYSEHQSGLAIDVNEVSDAFIGTPEAIWLAEHAHEYGFIIRYPEGKSDITGYKYEPWHIRYVGIETATHLYENELTIEEYLGIDSVYAE
ncbi:MAG: D-alanyl-D-alanine carboxypeptidase family protein [Oscillospiraceae bacterium]|nr:D-alanyl-D-alanine carboxypeptidase family protein [Oscillospiraceae bacterium]